MLDRYPWPPPDLVDWCADVDKDPTPEWLLHDLVPADAAVLISGRAKVTYKTFFTFDMVCALATGQRVAALNPVFTEGVPGAVFELEGPRKQVRRRWSYLMNSNGHEITRGRVKFAHRYPLILSTELHQQRIANLVRDHQLRFVVIDTLAKSMRGDENDTKDISEVMRGIDTIRSAGEGTTVFYLHHLRKPSQDRGQIVDIDDELRGSSALSGFYDVHMAFRTPTVGRGLLLTVRASNAEEVCYRIDWDISSERECATLHMEKYNPHAVPDTRVCLEKLEQLVGGQTYSFKMLSEVWGLPAEVVEQIRNALLSNGGIERTARGVRRVM